ncbi:lantibiotic dehydratase [Streptomyces sp. NPDC093707]|uniref:lantibiotic dehydratase n=1 Tax=Streptomyces sp. NPDC093707 TaxID=3154984 RepID=UPI00344C0FFB
MDLPRDLDLFGDTTAARGWLAAVWRREDVRDALSAASPSLCQRIGEVLAGERSQPRQVRRAVISVASYLLRWQQRPTPFGLFAGVAPVQIAQAPKAVWGLQHHAALRADAQWLTSIVARLHQCPQLLERLAVVSSGAGQVRGDRYVVPGSPTNGQEQELAPVEVSVRYTRPVAAALAAAHAPIQYRELRQLLTRQFPTAPAGRIDAMLGGLVTQNILVTNLRAPMTRLDALERVCAILGTVAAHDIPDIASLVGELLAIRGELAGPAAAEARSARSGLADRMRKLSDVSVPLVTDTALNCDVQIPEQVAVEAQEAVGILHRLSPYPSGYPAWRNYHARFRARYGLGAVVPVLDLVADSGLGLPAGFLGSAYDDALRQLTERDEKLLCLVQQAMLEGSDEIVLTEPLISDLADGGADALCASRAEVSVEIHAASTDALARGAFHLLVTGTPRPASSMAGRFAHLLPVRDRDQLAGTFQAAAPGAFAAQLSFVPRRRRNENVARTMRLLPHVISLAEHDAPSEDAIPLADLAVTADTRRLCLVQLSTGRRVEPRVLHALEAGVHTPPLARFLAEISTARCAVYKSFDFGAAARLPFLPKVRYKRTILAPARWLLTRRDLPGREAEADAWDAKFEAWRARLRLPDRVTLTEHDQRLRLDLTHPVHRLVLRTRLNATGRLELREAPDPRDLAWLGRAHELLLPLVSTAPTDAESFSAPMPVHSVASSTGHLPGHSTILAAQVHAHPARYEEILTEHLPRLIEGLGHAPLWWFSRHRTNPRPDADQHLALCLRLPEPGDYSRAAEQLHTWAERLRREHLIAQLTLTTYERQSGQYGHGPALEAAYKVFAADSAAALAQIRMTTLGKVNPLALTAASMVDLAAHFAMSINDGLTWLTQQLPREHGWLDKTLRDQALDVADPHGPGATLRSLRGGVNVAATWQKRAAALTTYREHLAAQREPLTVLHPLLRLHHVRTLGVNADQRRVTRRLARACALRHTAGRTQ